MTASRTRRRPLRRWLAVLSVLPLAFVGYAWTEAHLMLVEDEVEVPVRGVPADPSRPPWVHVSDLHVHAVGVRERRLVAAIERLAPGLLLVTGDFLYGNPRELAPDEKARELAAVRQVVDRLVAACRGPVLAVLGNHDSDPAVPALLRAAGVTLLRNDSTVVATDAGPVRVVGLDFYERSGEPFDPDADGFARARVGSSFALTTASSRRNFYCHFMGDGARAWEDYRVTADLWFDDTRAGIGLVAASQLPWDDDRFARVRRFAGREPADRAFHLATHGGALGPDAAAQTLGPAPPEPGQWWRLALEVHARSERGVRLRAALVRPGAPWPESWPVDVVDADPQAPACGTIGLWTMGPGRKALDNVRVTDLRTGALRYAQDFERDAAGWDLSGTNTLLEHAFRGVAPQEQIIVLSHRPAPAPRAAALGAELILAGDTHGGQIAIPLLGPLLHPKAGARFVDGRYALEGGAVLYVSQGIGTSGLPLRFLRPPEITVLRGPATTVDERREK